MKVSGKSRLGLVALSASAVAISTPAIAQ
jgi:hypothetical protein